MQVAAASDVYSLGVVAYECLSGRRPFDGDSPVAIALAHITGAPPPLPPDVPPAVRLLVERALAKDPRPRSAPVAELAEAIRAVQARAVRRRTAAPAPRPPDRPARPAGLPYPPPGLRPPARPGPRRRGRPRGPHGPGGARRRPAGGRSHCRSTGARRPAPAALPSRPGRRGPASAPAGPVARATARARGASHLRPVRRSARPAARRPPAAQRRGGARARVAAAGRGRPAAGPAVAAVLTGCCPTAPGHAGGRPASSAGTLPGHARSREAPRRHHDEGRLRSMTTPQLLGERYEIGEVLGRGGMAEVHRGRDLRLGREVAVKVLRTDLARDPSFQVRFRREAQAAASLNHPAIVAVYDTGEDRTATGATAVHRHGVRRGRDAARRAPARGPAAAPSARMELVADICAALDFSHRNGIVHRDVKPGNVMITRRRGQGDGLRHRPGRRRLRRHDDPDRRGHRHRAVPVAGAGPRRERRRPLRRLLDRLPALRAGHRRPPFTGDSPSRSPTSTSARTRGRRRRSTRTSRRSSTPSCSRR